MAFALSTASSSVLTPSTSSRLVTPCAASAAARMRAFSCAGSLTPNRSHSILMISSIGFSIVDRTCALKTGATAPSCPAIGATSCAPPAFLFLMYAQILAALSSLLPAFFWSAMQSSQG